VENQANEVVHQIIQVATTYGIDIVGAVAILIIGWIAAGWAGRATGKALTRTNKVDVMLQRFFANLVRYSVIVFTVLATLQQFGVQTTSFLAVLGTAGLAIGLALQGTLSNVAAGVMLLIFRPSKIGDFIEAGSNLGTVSDLTLFTTELTTAVGVFIVVQNSQLSGTSLRNFSRNPTRRIQIVLGIDYGGDINLAIETAKQVVAGQSLALTNPEPQYVVGELADRSVNIYVRVSVKTGDYWTVFFNLNKGLKEACDAAGITIPFPQRWLHIESGALPKD
jgi:small conductance mechanosensitive channel